MRRPLLLVAGNSRGPKGGGMTMIGDVGGCCEAKSLMLRSGCRWDSLASNGISRKQNSELRKMSPYI